jgi:hypothetical protein
MSKDKELSRADEMRVTIIAAWIDELGEKLKSDWARQRLRDYIRQKLVQGTLPTMDVIAAARAGNEDADVALRELAIEMLDRGEIPAAALRAYAMEALRRGPAAVSQGRVFADDFVRDIAIALMVAMAAHCWDLAPTRSPASKKNSAAALVTIALNRKGFLLGEARVNKIHGSRNQIAERLSASIPPV